MQILIKDKSFFGLGIAANWAMAMNKIAGQWVDVETKFLFKSSFNVNVPGFGGIGVSIHDIDDVKDDIRRYRKICWWCKKHSALVTKTCSCGRSDHFDRFFPKGKKKMPIEVEHENTDDLKKWEMNLGKIIEKCVFCKEPTRYWSKVANKPVCTHCAEDHSLSEIPKEKA